MIFSRVSLAQRRAPAVRSTVCVASFAGDALGDLHAEIEKRLRSHRLPVVNACEAAALRLSAVSTLVISGWRHSYASLHVPYRLSNDLPVYRGQVQFTLTDPAGYVIWTESFHKTYFGPRFAEPDIARQLARKMNRVLTSRMAASSVDNGEERINPRDKPDRCRGSLTRP